VSPDIYTGNATYSTLYQSVNSTHFEVVYRCVHCWVWEQDGQPGNQIPPTATDGNLVFGWAKHTLTPSTPADPKAYLDQHAYYGIAFQPVASMRNSAYTTWISKSPPTSTTTSKATTTAASTTTSAACAASQTAGTDTYDYIVAGAGAGGIPIAAKLAESGKKVLLLEKGPPSSGRWGGTIKPTWLTNTNLTRFDVPGLCNQIWVDSDGIACKDASSMAGCVLGGGTAINAGLWWKPNPADFDQNFPSGWRGGDMNGAINRVFQKIPGTYVPSKDGKTYLRQGFNTLASALSSNGWSSVDANAVPSSKNKVYSQTPYMFSNGERGGPMATYLVEASKRSNFNLLMNTSVKKIIRTGSRATGVELEAQNSAGKCGTVNLAANGKVIVSAGVFGTSKILMRSGIGPTDQLNIVKASSDGPSMIASTSWINLPVGKNLDDHTNTDVVIDNTDAQFYDFYAAYTNPIPSDKNAYLNQRSGILAQSAPNIGPVFWEIITGTDGSQRQLQWTARVEGGHDITANTSMVISQYLGRGKTSRGRLTITPSLSMTVSELPYVNTAGDVAAIVQGIKNLKDTVAKNPKLTMKYPAASQSVEDFVAVYPNSVGARTANHWVGTAKMGTDSGLNGGTAVVDTNTKVYGTDNVSLPYTPVMCNVVLTSAADLRCRRFGVPWYGDDQPVGFDRCCGREGIRADLGTQLTILSL
jgi:cellobiose dehydrogenase (acceptor)